jgi:acetyltransferase, GNAT family|nr:MAG TPA: acetyltransferase domain containing protein [Caudoviricetes sp.]
MAQLELAALTWGNEPPAHLRLIYEESFPIEERRPWGQLFGMSQWEHIAWLIRLDETPIGFAVGWELPSAHYFEYLVIDPAYRGQGLGAKVIEMLSYKYDDEYPVVLECEPAGYSPMAERRLAFYARMGLHPLPFDYLQPPYGEGLPWVDLHLLSNRAIEPPSFAQIRDEIYRYVYKVSSTIES